MNISRVLTWVSLLAIGISGPGVVIAGERAIWSQERIPVWDFSEPFWRPSVDRMVTAYNAILPPNAPKLVYTAMPETACKKLPKTGKRGGISVCSNPGTPRSGAANLDIRSGTFQSAIVVLGGTDGVAYPDQLICHEFAHAVLNAPDDVSRPYATTSCVQGFLHAPGAWEAAYATMIYNHPSKHRRRENHSKHHVSHRARA